VKRECPLISLKVVWLRSSCGRRQNDLPQSSSPTSELRRTSTIFQPGCTLILSLRPTLLTIAADAADAAIATASATSALAFQSLPTDHPVADVKPPQPC
jgi:hypothetical protein